MFNGEYLNRKDEYVWKVGTFLWDYLVLEGIVWSVSELIERDSYGVVVAGLHINLIWGKVFELGVVQFGRVSNLCVELE